MTQFGEGAFIPAPPKEPKKDTPKETDKKPIKLRISVFFDGTLNNRENIDQRLGRVRDGQEGLDAKNQTYYKLALKQKAGSPKRGQSPQHVGTASASYEADYSNIVLLEENFKSTTEHEIYKAFYIEGVGTQDLLSVSRKYKEQLERHEELAKAQESLKGLSAYQIPNPKPRLDLDSDIIGAATAKGVTGIYTKMDAALLKIEEWFQRLTKEKEYEEAKHFVEEVVIDVFGFSRGAATARAFIDYMQKGERTVIGTKKTSRGRRPHFSQVRVPTLLKRLTVNGHIDASQAKVVIGFAGLFDTVSSYNNALLSDVKKLKLDAVKQARKAYHLASADEHRGCFSLTNIASAVTEGVGEEYFLPGVHSDIGGGYRDQNHEIEDMTLARLTNVPTLGTAKSLTELAKTLVKEGWMTATDNLLTPLNGTTQQIMLKKRTWQSVYGTTTYARAIQVYRHHMRNIYSRIPLMLMAEAAAKEGFIFRSKFKFKYKAPSELSDVDKAIRAYIARVGTSSKPEDWFTKSSQEINNVFNIEALRYTHLHYSAQMGIGHWPRFKKGRRARECYKG